MSAVINAVDAASPKPKRTLAFLDECMTTPSPFVPAKLSPEDMLSYVQIQIPGLLG